MRNQSYASALGLFILVAIGFTGSPSFGQGTESGGKTENDKNECVWLKKEYKLLSDQEDSNIDHQRLWQQNLDRAKKSQQDAINGGNPDLASSWDSDIQFASQQIENLQKENDEKIRPRKKELRKKIDLCDQTAEAPTGPETEHHGATMLVGMVLPSDRRPGDTITARLVTNSQDYGGISGLDVEDVSVPERKNGRGHAELCGLVVDTNHGKRIPAGGPVPLDIPATGAVPPIEVALADEPTQKMDVKMTEPAKSGREVTATTEPTIAPLIPDSGVCDARGKFSGDGTAMRVKVGDNAAPVIAASPREVFFQPSADTPTGENDVTITDAGKTTSFKIWADKLSIKADNNVLRAHGDSTQFTVTVTGLPDRAEYWKAPAGAGYAGKGGVSAAREGSVLLTIKNDSPAVGNITEGNVTTRTLHFADCPGGTCKVAGTFVADQPGTFQLEATLTPQLGEVAGKRNVIAEATPAPKGCCQYMNKPWGRWCTIETEVECLGVWYGPVWPCKQSGVCSF